MGQFLLGESQSRIFANVYAKIGCCQTVVSKKEGIHTPRSTCRTSLSNNPSSVLSERDIMNALIIADVYVLVINCILPLVHGMLYYILLFTVHIVSHSIDIHITNITHPPSSFQSRSAPSTDDALILRSGIG